MIDRSHLPKMTPRIEGPDVIYDCACGQTATGIRAAVAHQESHWAALAASGQVVGYFTDYGQVAITCGHASPADLDHLNEFTAIRFESGGRTRPGDLAATCKTCDAKVLFA